MKLSIELVPSTSFYNNVRSNVSKKDWDIIRKKSYKLADNKCEICGDNGKNQGYRHNVECHEIWEYDDITHTQTLTNFISLCPRCHKVKHIGLAFIQGYSDLAINHLKKVNGLSDIEASRYIEKAFKEHKERSNYEWLLDISYIDEYLEKI